MEITVDKYKCIIEGGMFTVQIGTGTDLYSASCDISDEQADKLTQLENLKNLFKETKEKLRKEGGAKHSKTEQCIVDAVIKEVDSECQKNSFKKKLQVLAAFNSGNGSQRKHRIAPSNNTSKNSMHDKLGKAALVGLGAIVGAAIVVPAGYIMHEVKCPQIDTSAANTCIEIDGLKYEALTDGTWTVSAGENFDGGSCIIPDEVDGKKVTAIKDHGFYNEKGLTEVVLTGGITHIGAYAFSCSDITKIRIENSDELVIAAHAFESCQMLQEVNVHASSVTYGEYCFKDCTELEDVDLGSHVKQICDAAFYNCKRISVFYYGDTFEKWDDVAKGYDWDGGLGFYDTIIVCEDVVASLDGHLRYVLLDDETWGVASMERPDYDYELVIPGYVAGRPVTRIYTDAFRYSENLTSVTIPKTVTWIGPGAFSDCPKLDTVYWDAENCTSDGYKSGKDGYWYEVFDKNLKSVEIGNSVKVIPECLFLRKYNLTDVQIGKKVIEIQEGAFSGCDSLVSVKIPASVEKVGKKAFSGELFTLAFAEAESKPEGWAEDWTYNDIDIVWNCSIDNVSEGGDVYFNNKDGIFAVNGNEAAIVRLYDTGERNLTIPNKISYQGNQYVVTEIASGAISYWKNLETLTIPRSIKSIEDGAVVKCEALEKISVQFGNTAYYSKGNCLIEKDSKSLILGCKTSVIPQKEGILEIADGAFRGVQGLQEITIPDSVITIGDSAFRDCASLSSVKMSENTESIGEFAFYGTKNLTEIDLNYGLKSIGEYAFYESGMPSKLVIPHSVEKMGNKIFESSSGITEAYLPNGTTHVPDYLFSGCSNLTELHVPSSVNSLGYQCLRNCNRLTKIAFDGTMEQWKSIRKDSSWDSSTGDYTVHCTDGTMSKADA